MMIGEINNAPMGEVRIVQEKFIGKTVERNRKQDRLRRKNIATFNTNIRGC